MLREKTFEIPAGGLPGSLVTIFADFGANNTGFYTTTNLKTTALAGENYWDCGRDLVQGNITRQVPVFLDSCSDGTLTVFGTYPSAYAIIIDGTEYQLSNGVGWITVNIDDAVRREHSTTSFDVADSPSAGSNGAITVLPDAQMTGRISATVDTVGTTVISEQEFPVGTLLEISGFAPKMWAVASVGVSNQKYAHSVQPLLATLTINTPPLAEATINVYSSRPKEAILTLMDGTVSVGDFIADSRSRVLSIDPVESDKITISLDQSFYNGELFSYAGLLGLPISDQVSLRVLSSDSSATLLITSAP